MPPVSQQGSRAGLITTLVLSIVVAIVFIITTIYFNSQFQIANRSVDDLKKKYVAVVTDDKITGEGEFTLARQNELKTELGVSGTTTLTDLLQQKTDKVTAAVTGSVEPYSSAIQKLQDAVSAASKTAPSAKIGANEPVVAVLPKLAAEVVTQQSAAKGAAKARDDATKSLADAQATLKAQLDKLDEQVKAADARATKAEQDKGAAEKTYAEMQGKADESSKKASDDATGQVQAAIALKQAAEAERDTAKKALEQIKIRLNGIRFDTTTHMLTSAVDGEIIRLGAGNVVYINLGSSDHLPPGLTFEVYDKNEGIRVNKSDALSDSNLPTGKASIEVVRIGQNSSECRVVHSAPGQTITQGDLIANLVYDRNTTYHFFVYGEFDVDQNGVYSAQEGDIIKSLVTRWGGKMDDKISIQTDFVILGREPKVPQLTQEEAQNDALLIAKKNAAEKALKEYQDIIFAASDLHIPIMNQNRFLYYVGYFDQAKR